MDVKALLSQMSLREKLAEMTQILSTGLSDAADGDVTGPMRAYGIRAEDFASIGTVLGTSAAADVLHIQKKHLENNPHKIPLLFMRDVIHGWRTVYPIPLGMGATFDDETVAECCRMAAKEAASAGITVNFSPMVDVARDSRWGRIMESTGEDPFYNAHMAGVMVKAYQGDLRNPETVAACVKHFAAYGAAESGRDYNTTDMSERTLRDYYLPPYKGAVDAGVSMVMTSFNSLNGVPGSVNTHLTHILRDEWKFDGVVITDWSAFYELLNHGIVETEKEAGELGIRAKNDIEMMSTCYLRFTEELIAEGKVTEKDIDDAVLRILTLKDKLGLFDDPYRSASPEKEKELFLCPAHRDIARRAAEKAAVLLKNEDVLPFSDNIRRVAVIGSLASHGNNGSWSCDGKEAESVSVLSAAYETYGEENVIYAKGYDEGLSAESDEALLTEAVEAAKNADAVILCLGENSAMSGESISRADIGLPKAEKELLCRLEGVNKNTAVCLFAGRALALEDAIGKIPALFLMWHPGTEGGHAALSLVTGKCNFEGRLPVSFPRVSGQEPLYYNHLITGRPKVDDNAPSLFQTHYIDVKNAPLFPFGYGLSYTDFSVSAPVLSAAKMKKGESVTLSVNVKNTGSVPGKTVIQLYIRDVVASLCRPIRELKDFKKIALLPGEEKTVTFTVTEEMLSFYSVRGIFEAEAGKFLLYASENAESGTPAELYLQN